MSFSVPFGSFSRPIPTRFTAVYIVPSPLGLSRPAVARLDSSKNDSEVIQTTHQTEHSIWQMG